MWTTETTIQPEPARGWDVHLLRNGEPFAVISLDDWWDMSATTCLVDEALRQEELDFKMSELYGPKRTDVPMWTTNLVGAGESCDVHLLRDGRAVATMSLEEWLDLSATRWAIEDAVEVAEGLFQYGSNIEEVKEALRYEEGFEAEDDPPKPDPSDR